MRGCAAVHASFHATSGSEHGCTAWDGAACRKCPPPTCSLLPSATSTSVPRAKADRKRLHMGAGGGGRGQEG